MVKLKALNQAFIELKKQAQRDSDQLKASNTELQQANEQLESALFEAQESKVRGEKLNDLLSDLQEEKKVLQQKHELMTAMVNQLEHKEETIEFRVEEDDHDEINGEDRAMLLNIISTNEEEIRVLKARIEELETDNFPNGDYS